MASLGALEGGQVKVSEELDYSMAMSYLQQARNCGGFCTITCQYPIIIANNSRCRTDPVRYFPIPGRGHRRSIKSTQKYHRQYSLNSPLRCCRLHSESKPKSAWLIRWRACCLLLCKVYLFPGLVTHQVGNKPDNFSNAGRQDSRRVKTQAP